MGKKITETIPLYRKILRWNGESASDLLETVRRLAQAAPAFLIEPLPALLRRYRYARAMRFDTSEMQEPILAVDKRGFALVGTLRSLKVQKLATI